MADHGSLAEAADASPVPDLMNDSAFDTNTSSKVKTGGLEAETCRICRAEGTDTEPLFYPCKCNGSIKFVHQECLMEWLSHSQKKYCELCKTGFRFTKLYDAHMPPSVPTPVFLRHMVQDCIKTLLTWSRFLIVCFVWLGWLPWSMRAVWRFLFWIGDGEWATWHRLTVDGLSAKDALETSQERLASVISGSSGTGALLGTTSTSQIHDTVPSLISTVSQTLNLTAEEPSIFRQIRQFLFSFGFGSSNASTLHQHAQPRMHQSFLSQFKFFNSFTRSKTVNNLLIDTIEGQMITLLVVLAFILIFLIREWVVQQQPGLNLAGGMNADLLVPRPDPLPADEHPDDEPPENGPNPEDDNLEDLANDPEHNAEDQPEQNRVLPGRARPLARPRRRTHYPQMDQNNSSQTSLGGQEGASISNTASAGSSITNFGELPAGQEMFSFTAGAESSENGARRPALLTRNALSKATEIQRAIEEDGRPEKQRWPGLDVFMKIWQRAGGAPEQVLEIIEDEGKTEELGWIVDAMKRLQDSDPQNPPTHLQIAVPAARKPTKSVDEDVPSNGSNESWLDVGVDMRPDGSPDSAKDVAVRSPQTVDTPTKDKGKQRESSNIDEENETSSDPLYRHDLHANPADCFTASGHPSPGEDSVLPGPAEPKASVNYNQQNNSTSLPLHPGPSNTSRLQDSELTESNGPSEEENSEISSVGGASSVSEGTENVDAPAGIPVVEVGILEKISIWLWAVDTAEPNPEAQPLDDEHIIRNVADEAPFVPVINEPVERDPEPVEQDPVQDIQPGPAEPPMMINDVEAIEEGEDFEGVMELIGMQGPLTGLFQNGMFSAVLVSATVGGGVWFPYIWGKLVLLLLANPLSLFVKMPLRLASAFADIFVDITLFFTGSFVYWTYQALSTLTAPLAVFMPVLARFHYAQAVAAASRSIAEGGLDRMARTAAGINLDYSEADLPIFSILSHEALNYLRNGLYQGIALAWDVVCHVFSFITHPNLMTRSVILKILFWPLDSRESLKTFSSLLTRGLGMLANFARLSTGRLSLDLPPRPSPIDPNLAYWQAGDRTIAILAGYGFFALLGALYLKKRNPFSTSEQGKKVEGMITDVLQQAGGVIKVILIISIEMIAFPLYCGLLLDMALLPLFEGVTFTSRVNFTINSPWTSVFVHWFVGTCYMFHFALFVSMCRKIMRSGVLYFIRDPDDPTFHPVRDVLERSVAAQLRKITFSALVYGALVIVCLGGVVWGMFFALDGVLPIHWSSNEPVLEFPVDLLFYNFLMPLAVRFFKPSDGLADMYTWWFKKCARMLRLTWFMFGERKTDEEGSTRAYWTRFFFQEALPQQPSALDDSKQSLDDELDQQAETEPSTKSGRYVRAPAADQVRIPKGGPVFLEVNEKNERVDGQPEQETGQFARSNNLFTQVYIPPFFRLRIALFIILIWLFAAFTGVSLTILPLIIGRMIFASLIPSHLRMNDVYAFSIGICILGSLFYAVRHARRIIVSVLPATTSTPLSRRLRKSASHLARLVYMYSVFLILLPSLVALVMEAYLIIPLHSYLAPQETHIMHFVQDWTLGILYLKMLARLILHYSTSRPAGALRAVTRNGYLNPNAALATRAFILPAFVLMGTALILPLGAGRLANALFFSSRSAEYQALVYRFAYPAVAASVGWIVLGFLVTEAMKRWRSRVRDEVYLVGERLHNFSERGLQGRRAATTVMAA